MLDTKWSYDETEALGDDEYDDYGNDYAEDFENYGSDLSGYADDGSDREEKARVDKVRDSAFLMNETDGFAGRPDAEKIRDNFRQYVKDVKSDNIAAQEMAKEGACKDLEFFIISLISRSFSTYVEKDRTFFEDLVQAGRMGVILSLAKYDPDKSMPTTYFYNPIKHELVMEVNTMKHGTKSYMATAKKKIREVDRQFAKYGRTPTLHDYVYGTKCPPQRIERALAEIRAGNVKVSIDDPEVAQLADTYSSMPGPDESAISNVNASRIIRILYKIEPKKEIVDCFIDMVMDGKVKTSELAKKYGLTQAEVTEGIRNLRNLARYHPEIRKMYPERFKVKENELSE